MRKWHIREVESFRGGTGRRIRVFEVRAEGSAVGVWYSEDDGVASCCSCQGFLTAMKESCAHARAVKRHVKREVSKETK